MNLKCYLIKKSNLEIIFYLSKMKYKNKAFEVCIDVFYEPHLDSQTRPLLQLHNNAQFLQIYHLLEYFIFYNLIHID